VATGETDRTADDAQTRSLLAAIVESSVDAIASMTMDGIVTSWNSGAEAMYGYTAEEMTGRHISVLYPPDRTEELEPILAQIRRGRQVHHFESQRVRKDGTVIDVSLSVSPIRGEGGVIVGSAVVTRDVTERNWAEAEQRAAEAGRQESARIETAVRLAGGVAAQFSTLLSSIMGYAASAAEATAANPLVRADIEQIQAAAGRAARLDRELLLFSRREPTRPERVDLNAVLAGMRDVLQASVGADIELRLITAPYLPTVLADRGQIEQVLVNLSRNARDAMPEGGILTFTTGAADLSEAPGAVWSGTRPGLCAKLTVTDTGHGMDAETMSRAFEPFFTTRPPDQGTGLGLSAVYGIVTKAGGGIAIDSEEGLGTTVNIYLPAAYVPAQGSAPMRSPGTAPTILVVDDQPAVLEVVSRILRHNGYHTLEAGSYEGALSLLSTHDPDLLLTDSVVAEVPEQTLADRVREIKPGMRILRMSGAQVTALGPEGGQFINKPFTAKNLVEKVRAILDVPPEYLRNSCSVGCLRRLGDFHDDGVGRI
jgi:two-component system cell cycle sensor histidine kinase/response regulator CckA